MTSRAEVDRQLAIINKETGRQFEVIRHAPGDSVYWRIVEVKDGTGQREIGRRFDSLRDVENALTIALEVTKF